MTYLMSISIGPVQDFIATARRSRDLWFGSWLLSELAKAAAGVIINKHEKESLIFPFVDDPSEIEDETFNAPNKLLAKVENPNEIALEIKSAIKARLIGIRDKAFKDIKGTFQKDIAEKQIEEITEVYWAAVPFEESQYAEARRKVEYLLSARKSTRGFTKVLWGDYVPKSALDGQRESVIPEDVFKSPKEQKLWKVYGIREKERLCGVGLLKRHGNRGNQGKFFSTSHIAALPLLNKIKDKGAVTAFIDKLRHLGISDDNLDTTPRGHPVFGNHDGHLLFEERMRDYFDEGNRSKAEQAVKEFLKTALNGKSPSPYYAVLLADGDSMGKAIDAQMKEGNPIERHRDISKTLSEFAKSVKEIVDDKHEGSLIYAGGDDVLALAPLHRVLSCAKKLSDDFKEKLSDFTYEDGKSPTLSVGIAIVHHIEPLQDALALARQAEKEAKSVEGKNALAIIVDKRSGVPKVIKDSWKSGFYERLQTFAKWHKEDEIPDSAAYQLRDLSNRLEVTKEKVDEDTLNTLEKIKIAEAIRILQRKRAKQGQESVDKQKIETLKRLLSPENKSDKKISVGVLADELIIAKVFADAELQAEGK